MTTRQTPDAVREAVAAWDKLHAGLRGYGMESLTIDTLSDHFAVLASRADDTGEGWRCYHCGETFADDRCARLHFGRDEECTPACQIKAGAEQGLLGALREAEYAAADAQRAIAEECTESAKAYYAQATRHASALRNAEEAGYERGLADGRALSATPAPAGDDDDIDSLAARLDMVRVALFGIIDNPASAVPLARAGLDFCDLTEAQRIEMRGDAPAVVAVPAGEVACPTCGDTSPLEECATCGAYPTRKAALSHGEGRK